MEMERDFIGYAAATAAVIVAYAIAAWARSKNGNGWSGNILVITQGAHARASISKLQLFFFTLVVLWAVVADLFWTGRLIDLSSDILVLLGIGAAGTAGGKITAIAKKQLSFENRAWLMRKGWIKESIEREPSDRKPEFGDLLRSGNEFDISKFQLLVFSLVIGVALIYFTGFGPDAKSLSNFEIPAGYLGLIGLSQVVYVGGKAVGTNTKADLDKKLNEVRKLETAFITAADKTWAQNASQKKLTLDTARAAAPEAYRAYRLRAEEAATMVGECIGGNVSEKSIEPSIPG